MVVSTQIELCYTDLDVKGHRVVTAPCPAEETSRRLPPFCRLPAGTSARAAATADWAEGLRGFLRDLEESGRVLKGCRRVSKGFRGSFEGFRRAWKGLEGLRRVFSVLKGLEGFSRV